MRTMMGWAAAVLLSLSGCATKQGAGKGGLGYDAPHAFANPSAPGRYNAEAAAAAWNEVRGFLATHLKPGAEARQ